MRQMPIALALIATVVLAGCGWLGAHASDDPIRVERGEPFWLRVGQTATVPDGAALTFRGVVSDTRCPEDAVCIVAGEAGVEIETVALEAPGTVVDTLGIGPGPRPHRPGGDRVQLLDLRPYPRVEQPQPDLHRYRARFVIE